MDDLRIREALHDEEFAAWFDEVLRAAGAEADEPTAVDDHYLVLTDEIGDWIGGLRYTVRGGVAHLLGIMIRPEHRHHGHAHRLLNAFEEHAREAGAHLAEFWTSELESEGLFAALGWHRILKRDGYIGGQTWLLLDKALQPG